MGLNPETLKPLAEQQQVKALKTERKRKVFEGKPEELAEQFVEVILSEGVVRK